MFSHTSLEHKKNIRKNFWVILLRDASRETARNATTASLVCIYVMLHARALKFIIKPIFKGCKIQLNQKIIPSHPKKRVVVVYRGTIHTSRAHCDYILCHRDAGFSYIILFTHTHTHTLAICLPYRLCWIQITEYAHLYVALHLILRSISFLILYIYTISVFEFFLDSFFFIVNRTMCDWTCMRECDVCRRAFSAPLRHRASSASFRQLSIRFTMRIWLCITRRRVLSPLCMYGGGSPFYAERFLG